MNSTIGKRKMLQWLAIVLTAGTASVMTGHSLLAQQGAPGQIVASTAPTKVLPKQDQHKSEGERVFAENCSRCHNAPDGFSSRISGTIVRHMRVRASLSERDEKALLQFFNPQ